VFSDIFRYNNLALRSDNSFEIHSKRKVILPI
jgi:hypothetical protein